MFGFVYKDRIDDVSSFLTDGLVCVVGRVTGYVKFKWPIIYCVINLVGGQILRVRLQNVLNN